MSKSLDAILAQYEKNTEPSKSGNKLSNEERLKKYFTEKLPKGVKTQTKTFRILPAEEGKSPFTEVFYHEKNVNGKWEKIYCNHLNDGEHCPLCEAKDALYEDGSEKAKVLAKDFFTRKFYVVKGIDRENEDHGVKFWRFKHKKTGDGVMDKLIPVFKLKGDITHPREGRDIIITSGRNDKGHSVVNSIMTDDVSILTNNKDYANEWMSNEETHRDVYAKKSNEYLEIVATNKTPIWDSEQKKYVAEEDKEEKETASLTEEINMMRTESTESFESNYTNDGNYTNDLTNNDVEVSSLEDDDELPF
jgi:hypothetical protein